MKKYFGIAAMLLALAACNKVETDTRPDSVRENEEILITATLAPKTGGTKAVADNGDGKITVTWAKDEHMAILYEGGGVKKMADARITDVDADGRATIEFSVVGATNNTPCTIVYPFSAAKDDCTGVKDAATLLAAQNGTLNADLDVRVGEGTILISKPSLSVSTQPAAQFAIFKLTLRMIDGTTALSAKPLTAFIGGQNYTVKPTTATDVLYVALPAVSDEKVSFLAEGPGRKTYVFSSPGASFAAGKYYQSTLALRECVDLGTEITVGGVTRKLLWATCNIGADNPWDNGKYYAWGETADRTMNLWTWGYYEFGPSGSFSRYTGSDYTTLLPENDVVAAKWGSSWRIPTREEYALLFDNSNFKRSWTNDYREDSSNRKGYVISRTSGPCKGNHIFLPAAGFGKEWSILSNGVSGNYWSSSYDTTTPENAAGVYFHSGGFTQDYGYRYYGRSVRAVIEL